MDGFRDRDPHFVRACAVDMHTDVSQEPLYAEFTRKMPPARVSTSINAPASIPIYRKNPSVWTHFFGKKLKWFKCHPDMEQQHQECHDPETYQKWKINGTIIHQIQETPLKHCRFLQEKLASHTLEPQHMRVCCIFKP